MNGKSITMFVCFFLILGVWVFAPSDVIAGNEGFMKFFKGMKDEKKGDEIVPVESTDYKTGSDSDTIEECAPTFDKQDLYSETINGYDPRTDNLLRGRFLMRIIYVNNAYRREAESESDGTWEKPYTTITEALDALVDPTKQALFVVKTNLPYSGFTVSEDFTTICGQGYDIPDIGLPYGLSAEYPIISGPVTIDASNVEIAGFSFEKQSPVGTGITIVSGDGTSVHNNDFLLKGPYCTGIAVKGGTCGMISDNTFTGSGNGIINETAGKNMIFSNEFDIIGRGIGIVLLRNSSSLTVKENTIHSKRIGIYSFLSDSPGTSGDQPLIIGNEITVNGTGSGSGIVVMSGYNNDLNVNISDNTISVTGDDYMEGLCISSFGGGGCIGTDDVPATVKGNTITIAYTSNSLEPHSVGIRIGSDGDTFTKIQDNSLNIRGWVTTGIEMSCDDVLDTTISDNNIIVDGILVTSGINLHGRPVKGIVDGNDFLVFGKTNLYVVKVGEEFDEVPTEEDTIGTPEEPFYITNNTGICSDLPNILGQRGHHGIVLCTINPGAGNNVIWSGTNFTPLGSDWSPCDYHQCYDSPNCNSYGGGMVQTNFVGEDYIYPDAPQP